jgi:hypothetical protein
MDSFEKLLEPFCSAVTAAFAKYRNALQALYQFLLREGYRETTSRWKLGSALEESAPQRFFAHRLTIWFWVRAGDLARLNA